MKYRIGIVERDNMYLERLVEFLRSHHGDSLEVNIADGSSTDWMDVELDDLDMASMKYEALFIGDDIAVETSKIPSGVQIAYLTAEASGENYLEISKYQRLEQIYRQIIDVCKINDTVEGKAEDKPEETGNSKDLELFTENKNGEVYRAYRLSDDDDTNACGLEMKMLVNNKIPGLARVTYCEDVINYTITNKIGLVDFVRKNRDYCGKRKLLKVFYNIFDTMLGLEEYMLLSDKLLLMPEEIYLDEESLETALLYFPFSGAENKQNAAQLLYDLTELCSRLRNSLKEDASKETEGNPGAGQENRTGKEENAGTEIFSELQHTAKESLKLKKKTVLLSDTKPAAYLVRKKTGEKVLINRNIFKLGKDEQYVDYCIKGNPTVSRNHADIVRKQDGFYVVDKGSLNHTFLNGKLIEPKKAQKLKKGDLVQIADEVFEFNS